MPDVPQQPAPVDNWKAADEQQRDFYRNIFVTGEMSLTALCRRYQLNYEAVKKFAQAHGWADQRSKFQLQFSENEEKEHKKILADIRRVLLASMRTMCLWYAEQLASHEFNNSVNTFPLDEWATKIEKFVELVEKMAGLSGIKKEALVGVMINQQNNTQVNFNESKDSEEGEQGPPGVFIEQDSAQRAVKEILSAVTRQTKPREVVVDQEIQTGAR